MPMFSYQFEIQINTSLKHLKSSLSALSESFTVQLESDEHFVAERVNAEQKAYFVPTSIDGNILQENTHQFRIQCQAKLSASGMFRQVLISIILASIIMMTWQQKATYITVAQLICGIVIVGSFLNGWRTITADARLFKQALKDQIN